MRDAIGFWLDGEVATLRGVDPTMTLLDWLRGPGRRKGSKEGCAEGDCGACTVLLGALDGSGRLIWRAVNSCILFLPMLDGRALITVESLAAGGELHPVQQAMVRLHGSQCGFCTPGIVMSLYGRAIAARGTVNVPVKDVLAGNLCRCTGYGPILAAAQAVPLVEREDDAASRSLEQFREQDPLLLSYADALAGRTRRWFAPRRRDQLAAWLIDYPDARIVAGATDVGLWVTKQYRILDDIVFIGDVAELDYIIETDNGVTLGATARYADAQEALARLHPDLGELVRRIGAVQVRNAGTVGGNIANGSPIGDLPPALIALGATLTLRRGEQSRQLALEDYFIAYGKQDRQAGEFVESLFVPRPQADLLIRISKLSKRFDSDISSVCGAIALTLQDGIITTARIAYGGMAGTPKRAAACEASLTGASFTLATMERAAASLREDFVPLTDMRGSAHYRLTVAGNLLLRLWHERNGPAGGVLAVEAVDA